MEKSKYILINSDNEYFVEISKVNKVMFTKDLAEATQVPHSDTQELIPIIEMYTGKTVISEQCSWFNK